MATAAVAAASPHFATLFAPSAHSLASSRARSRALTLVLLRFSSSLSVSLICLMAPEASPVIRMPVRYCFAIWEIHAHDFQFIELGEIRLDAQRSALDELELTKSFGGYVDARQTSCRFNTCVVQRHQVAAHWVALPLCRCT